MALVVRVTGDCSSCGLKMGFGNVGVHGDHILRGCKRCRHLERIPLPELRKKVLYLDQSILSSAFRQRDTAAVALVERVKQAALNELLVAPYSSVHEDETHMLEVSRPELVKPLMDFIKRTSGGLQFEPAYNVEHTQVHDAYYRWLAGASTLTTLDRKDAILDEVDEWNDYFFIDLPGYFHDPAANSANKRAALTQLLNAIDNWRVSNLSFDEAVRFELKSAGQEYIHAYLQMIAKASDGDVSAFLNAPIITQVLNGMLSDCQDDELVRRFTGLGEFFASDHFGECPYQWVSTRMFVVLRHQVRHDNAYINRQKAEKKLLGFTHDVRHIATYAPYCDAIFVDNAMAHILRDSRLALEKRYGTRVFSRKNQPQFEAWLSELEDGIDDFHRAALKLIHPERGV